MHSESIDKKTKYVLEKIGQSLLAKSYFDDADNDPMPLMTQDIEWSKVKEIITDKAKKLLEGGP